MPVTTIDTAAPYEALSQWLRDNGVHHELHQHPETFTARETATIEGVDPRTFAKVVGVQSEDGRRALLVVDAPERVDLHKARRALGARDVRLLTEDELRAIAPDCDAGAIPAIGQLFDLPMIADPTIGEDAEISFNAGSHRFAVRVDRRAWEQATGVTYADIVMDEDAVPDWAR